MRRLLDLPTIVTLAALIALTLCVRPAEAGEQCGEASYYCCEHHGRLTASGEPFDQWAMTAAMPSRAMMGSMVRVCLVSEPNRCVTVRVNDLGPHASLNRVIDLSLGAARALGMEQAGVARVCLEW